MAESMYDVTLVGSWSSSTKALTAKEAAEKLLRKNEVQLQNVDFELVKDNVAPKVTVMLHKKTGRKVLNKYNIVIKGKRSVVTSVNSRVDNMSKKTLEAKLGLVKMFKEAKNKERERFAKEFEKTYTTPQQIADWEENVRPKANLKTMIKQGATASAIAKAYFDKQSKDIEETIMSAENFKSKYNILPQSSLNKTGILKALREGVCLILQRKASGGVTAFLGTTNLELYNSIYEQNIYILYKLASELEDYMNITDTKVNNVKNPKQTTTNRAPYVQIASCSLRMKDETKREGKTSVPTGRYKVSSLEYSVVYDRVICMVQFTGLPQVDKTVTGYLAEGFFNAKGSDEEFAKKFAFDRKAFVLALQTYQDVANGGSMPTNEIIAELNSRAKQAGISDADVDIYRRAKDSVLNKNVVYILKQQLPMGLTDVYAYQTP